jgi:hypothetical protein
MKNSSKLVLVMLFIITAASYINAQQAAVKKTELTGNLFTDSKIVSTNYSPENTPAMVFQTKERKNRWLAGLFSLILPGSGEFYAGSYLKAAIFVAVEAAAITTALVYNHKGDNQTQFFQNYANQHWSASRYAYWTAKNLKTLAPSMSSQDVTRYQTAFSDPNSSVSWSLMNQMEAEIGSDPDAHGYTHQLPPQGEQQYYELIGKYSQYSHGWDTSNLSDPDYHTLTSQFLWYAGQRGQANHYYSIGSTGVAFIYINHFLSAIDGVWSVDRYNNTIAMNMRVQPIRTANKIDYMPTLNLSYNF